MKNTRDDIIKIYKENIKLIKKFNKHYYSDDSPIIDDFKYDKIKKLFLLILILTV